MKKITYHFLVKLIIITCFSTTYAQNDGHKIIGEWLKAEKDMKVQVFHQNGVYQAKVVWFACDTGFKMSDFNDKKNPNSAMKNRPWLGMQVLENLRFKGDNEWGDGQIYDPNSGHTFKSVCRMDGENTLNVRGYWLYEWMGKSLKFYRINN